MREARLLKTTIILNTAIGWKIMRGKEKELDLQGKHVFEDQSGATSTLRTARAGVGEVRAGSKRGQSREWERLEQSGRGQKEQPFELLSVETQGLSHLLRASLHYRRTRK